MRFILLLLLPVLLSLCDPIDEDMGIIIRRQVPNIVCVGDSLTYGTGASVPGGSTSYPGQLATSLSLTYGFRVINLGVPSLGLAGLPDPDYLLDDYNLNWLIVHIGINDIYAAGSSAAAAFALLQTYVTARAAAGWNVIICTLTGNVAPGTTAGEKVIAAAYDTLIKANYTRYADLAANANIGNATSGSVTYYDADGLHLNDTGYGVMSGIIQPVVGTGTTVRATKASSAGYALSGLTGYYRDWVALSPSTAQPDISPIYSLAAGSLATRTFTASGTFPQWVQSAVNGRPALDFDAASTHFMVSAGSTWASYVTTSAGSIRGVMKVNSIAQNNTTNRNLNDGIVGDASNNILIYMRNNSSPTLGFWAWNGGTEPYVEVAAPALGTWFEWEAVIESNKLKLAINGAALTSSAGNANALDLSGQMRIGRNGGTAYGDFTLAQLTMRQDAGNSQRSTYHASDVARYGL